MNPYQPTHPPSPSPHEPKEDIRIQITKTIWGCATGMLGISIPLSAITNSAIIPIVVVAGAAFGTAAVWLSKGGQASARPVGTSPELEERLRELEERLANVEVISSFERNLAERTAQSVPVAATAVAPVPTAAPVAPVESARVDDDVLAPSPEFSTYKKVDAKEHRNRTKNQPLAS